MHSKKLETFLVLLYIFHYGHADTTVLSSPSYSKPPVTNDQNEATTENLSNVTVTPTNSAAGNITIGKGVYVFASGSNLSITCTYKRQTTFSNADIQKLAFYDNFNNKFDTNRGFTQDPKMKDMYTITVTLMKEKVSRSDAGKYVCKYEGVPDIHTEVVVVHFTTTPDEYNTTLGNKQNNKLECKYTISQENVTGTSQTFQIEQKWKMGDNLATSVSDRHKLNGSSILTIEKAEWSDVGPYTCEVKLIWGSSSAIVSTIVPLKGEPKIGKMDTSKNVVQEDDVELKCPVTGFPYPTITWKKDGQPLPQDRRISLAAADNKYENAILYINNLEFEDKGEYTCNATNEVNPSGVGATITLRVKDKFAALWPFLGIVAEVIVLCIIIFIYEKKRSREMEDEADGGDDIANADDHKGKDVREILIQGEGIKWFKENSSFEIFCSYSNGPISDDMLKFFDVSGNELAEDRGFSRTVLSSTQNQVNISLAKDRIQTDDIGRYICRYGNGPSIYVHVAVVQVNTTPQMFNQTLEPQQDYTISCVFRAVLDNETKDMVGSSKVNWFKNNIAAEQISTRHIANKSMLTIKNAVWSDIGLYSCDYTVSWGTNSTSVIHSTVAFKGEVRINERSLPKSVNLIQDEDLELTCPVSGYPYPDVTWQIDGMNISPDNRRTVSTDPTRKYQNAVLKVFKVQFEDRGKYTCTGSSDLNTVTSSLITVRVKDKYAAVWPFIGIVVEVIVLGLVIFLCEKRRKHREEQAEANAELDNIASKRTSEKRRSDVRQRSTTQ
ncbi:hemicentin-1-like [Saccostrea echinata]|uniref:hemicentin-1-like n=1 Tax=Saccostrea echinata TaxID=191078 RepID=UPI002A7FD84D|nr:hemicentin-1-like [Saccostrea echinata]